MRIDKRMLEDIPAWLAKQDDIPGGWIYIGDEKERYLLGQPGRINMLVFGVNPSTASAGENNLDPTIKRVRKFVQKDPTCDGWIMANLYPLRATNPDDLPAKADKKRIEKNLKVLKALQKSYFIDKVWAAWGDLLKGDGLASDKFWELEKKIKKDKKNPGVLLQDVRRSNFHMHLASLVRCEVISMDDLEEFSDETKETIERMVSW